MKWFAPHALLPGGWAERAVIEVDDAGTIVSVTANARGDDAETLRGPVVPAMPNAHSHAFQRAIAGRTGRPSQDRDDSFWSWRSAMYAFLDHLDPDGFEAIAAQAYVEMLKSGYASVAEFHYVHHDPHGRPYADRAELAMRIASAAQRAGIGLTLLPVFYAHAGFGGRPPTEGQRRFVHDVAGFATLVERLMSESEHRYVLGIAPHSLRAVAPVELAAIVRLVPADAPVHIHAAEQTREVDECVEATGRRPVEWLLAHAEVNARWCIVHATHMTERESDALAASGAVAGLAPTTEADLGDGIFAAPRYLAAGGAMAVGSDSNTVISPFEELRVLEWSQRLAARRRNVLADASGLAVGASLWQRAARGGAQAIAQPVGAIEAGRRADLVVLDADDPALAEQRAGDALDAAIFGPARNPVRDVIAGGRFVVRDGRHLYEDMVFERYRRTLARLAS
ncbi:MAG: formimidoylglutamate deiminase [Burkholderiales bacterium]